MSAVAAVERWLAECVGLLSWERVDEGFWYVRVPGTARRVIPVEVFVDSRTVRVLSYFMIPPDENADDAYRYLLRHNWSASGVAFAVAPDGAVALVTRIPLELVDAGSLDDAVGRIVDATERTFQSYLRIGFPAFFSGERPPAD